MKLHPIVPALLCTSAFSAGIFLSTFVGGDTLDASTHPKAAPQQSSSQVTQGESDITLARQ